MTRYNLFGSQTYDDWKSTEPEYQGPPSDYEEQWRADEARTYAFRKAAEELESRHCGLQLMNEWLAKHPEGRAEYDAWHARFVKGERR